LSAPLLSFLPFHPYSEQDDMFSKALMSNLKKQFTQVQCFLLFDLNFTLCVMCVWRACMYQHSNNQHENKQWWMVVWLGIVVEFFRRICNNAYFCVSMCGVFPWHGSLSLILCMIPLFSCLPTRAWLEKKALHNIFGQTFRILLHCTLVVRLFLHIWSFWWSWNFFCVLFYCIIFELYVYALSSLGID